MAIKAAPGGITARQVTIASVLSVPVGAVAGFLLGILSDVTSRGAMDSATWSVALIAAAVGALGGLIVAAGGIAGLWLASLMHLVHPVARALTVSATAVIALFALIPIWAARPLVIVFAIVATTIATLTTFFVAERRSARSAAEHR